MERILSADKAKFGVRQLAAALLHPGSPGCAPTARNSHLCGAGLQPCHKLALEYLSTACAPPRTERSGADSPAQSPSCDIDVRTCRSRLLVTHDSSLGTAFLTATADPRSIGILSDHRESRELSSDLTEKHALNEEAKKKLIATFDKLKIESTNSEQRTSHFLTATRSLFPESLPPEFRYLLTATFSSLAFGIRSVIFVVLFARIIIHLSHSENTPFEYARRLYWPGRQRAN